MLYLSKYHWFTPFTVTYPKFIPDCLRQWNFGLYVLLFWHIHAKTPRGIVVCEQLQNYLIYSVNVTIMRKTYIGVYTPFYT